MRLARSLVRAASTCASVRAGCLLRAVLQNFSVHIRQIPHFDTRFGVAQALSSPPQKRAFCILPGRRVGAVLLRAENCSKWQFLGSKRVSKWGNFLISINSFCKRSSQRIAVKKTRSARGAASLFFRCCGRVCRHFLIIKPKSEFLICFVYNRNNYIKQ